MSQTADHSTINICCIYEICLHRDDDEEDGEKAAQRQSNKSMLSYFSAAAAGNNQNQTHQTHRFFSDRRLKSLDTLWRLGSGRNEHLYRKPYSLWTNLNGQWLSWLNQKRIKNMSFFALFMHFIYKSNVQNSSSCFVLKFYSTPLKESTRLRKILHFFNANTALYWQYDNTSHLKKTASFLTLLITVASYSLWDTCTI